LTDNRRAIIVNHIHALAAHERQHALDIQSGGRQQTISKTDVLVEGRDVVQIEIRDRDDLPSQAQPVRVNAARGQTQNLDLLVLAFHHVHARQDLVPFDYTN